MAFRTCARWGGRLPPSVHAGRKDTELVNGCGKSVAPNQGCLLIVTWTTMAGSAQRQEPYEERLLTYGSPGGHRGGSPVPLDKPLLESMEEVETYHDQHDTGDKTNPGIHPLEADSRFSKRDTQQECGQRQAETDGIGDKHTKHPKSIPL
jgi:hypothetical protein